MCEPRLKLSGSGVIKPSWTSILLFGRHLLHFPAPKYILQDRTWTCQLLKPPEYQQQYEGAANIGCQHRLLYRFPTHHHMQAQTPFRSVFIWGFDLSSSVTAATKILRTKHPCYLTP
ncbi:hypothetical protein MN608_02584 [Microdochium nivale]|nr:hypothetical protein MN608_02584 [Microdochium nivale]